MARVGRIVDGGMKENSRFKSKHWRKEGSEHLIVIVSYIFFFSYFSYFLFIYLLSKFTIIILLKKKIWKNIF